MLTPEAKAVLTDRDLETAVEALASAWALSSPAQRLAAWERFGGVLDELAESEALKTVRAACEAGMSEERFLRDVLATCREALEGRPRLADDAAIGGGR